MTKRARRTNGSSNARRLVALAAGAFAVALAGCGSSTSGDSDSDGASAASSAPSQPHISRKALRKRQIRQVVRGYYGDIASGEYRSAWVRLSPGMQGQFGGYGSWKHGYATTDTIDLGRVKVHASSRTEASADVKIKSTDTDVCGDKVGQTFEGTWSLSKSSGEWVATDISMSKVSGDVPAADVQDCTTPSAGGSTTPGAEPPTEPPPTTAEPTTERPPEDGSFCETHECVGDFGNEPGSVVECGDGSYSHAGGIQGACSHHGGVR
jgi:hypothetical protein